MKTLDEVIEAQERCATYPNCHFCFLHAGPVCEWIQDALHYLKAYRENQHAYEEGNCKAEEARERYLEAVKNCELAENKYKRLCKETSQITCPKCHSEFVILPDANNALTWDELRQMEGKPVWIECSQKAWGLNDGTFVDAFGDDCITIKVLHDLWHFQKKQIGKTWQAYRKERTE